MSTSRNFLFISLVLLIGTVYLYVPYLVSISGYTLSSYYMTPSYPLGILTSVFIYDGKYNWQWYMLYAIPFLFANVAYSIKVQAKRSLWAISFSFLIAFFVNLIFFIGLIFYHYKLNSYGQSGVVFSLIGIVVGMSGWDLIYGLYSRLRRSNDSDTPGMLRFKKVRLPISFASEIVILYLTVTYLIHPRMFFSVVSGTNYFVHIMCFILGILISIFALILSKDSVPYMLHLKKVRTTEGDSGQ